MTSIPPSYHFREQAYTDEGKGMLNPPLREREFQSVSYIPLDLPENLSTSRERLMGGHTD